MCVEQLPSDILNERTFDARHNFEDVFSELLKTRELCCNSTAGAGYQLGSPIAFELQTLVKSKTQTLHELPRHQQYSRHVIGTDNNWIGFICRWEPQTVSSIHGHPSFAYYHVIEGKLTMDLYDTAHNGQAKLAETRQMTDGECIWSLGETDRYDNLVHKVSTTEKPGFTLHLFSENPASGQHYSAT